MRTFVVIGGGDAKYNSMQLLSEEEVKRLVEEIHEDEYPIEVNHTGTIIKSNGTKIEKFLEYLVYDFDGGYAGDWIEIGIVDKQIKAK